MQYIAVLYSTFVQAFANPPSLESNKLGEQSYELPGAKVMGQAKTIKTDTDGYSNNSLTTCISSMYKYQPRLAYLRIFSGYYAAMPFLYIPGKQIWPVSAAVSRQLMRTTGATILKLPRL